jgi:hypothetical protein
MFFVTTNAITAVPSKWRGLCLWTIAATLSFLPSITGITQAQVTNTTIFARRQAKTSGEAGGCPFKRGSLFILELGSAGKGAANRDLVFLGQSWSRCPAEKWVPALLEGLWTHVSARLHEF